MCDIYGGRLAYQRNQWHLFSGVVHNYYLEG